VGRQFCFGLVYSMSSSVVVLPYLTVVPAISNALGDPADGSDDAEDTCDPMTAIEDADRLNDTRRSGAWNTEDHVNREEQVPSTEEEVEVIIQCLFLHVTIVDGSVPQQEGEWRNEDEVPDAGTQIAAAIFGTNGEVYDPSNHVKKQSGAQDEPQLEETSYQRARSFWYLICD